MKRSPKQNPRKTAKKEKVSNEEGEALQHDESGAPPGGGAPPPDADGQSTPEVEAATVSAQLRLLAHRLLAEQELERGEISQVLTDEIAQTLLGIGVRLAAMQQKVKVDVDQLIEDIVSAEHSASRSVAAAQRIAKQAEQRR